MTYHKEKKENEDIYQIVPSMSDRIRNNIDTFGCNENKPNFLYVTKKLIKTSLKEKQVKHSPKEKQVKHIKSTEELKSTKDLNDVLSAQSLFPPIIECSESKQFSDQSTQIIEPASIQDSLPNFINRSYSSKNNTKISNFLNSVGR